MTGEKVPSKRKIPKVEEIKKPLIIGCIIAAVAISGIVGGIYILTLEEQKKGGNLIIGMEWFLNSLDPLYNPDDACFTENFMVWDQIAEGLFEHDQSIENTPVIPNLAKDIGTWSLDGLNYTCQLREGVTFHDGTPFNATAVKWNFDRIYRFIDTKPFDDIWVWYYAYLQSDGKPIINETKVIDEYTVRFILNKPYVPLRALLACTSSYILSPSSTPEDDYVDKFTGKLIGTGPFILDSYIMDPDYGFCGNVTVIANRDYWGGKPLISEVDFLYFDDDEAMEKMLSGELSYTPWSGNMTMLDIYKNHTGTSVVPSTSTGVFYLAMNNDLFPLEMRKAISYAFNYSDFIKLWTDDLAVRCKSPLGKGMLYSNWDLNVAVYDIQVARHTLINANWEGAANLTADNNVSAGNPWERLVDEGTPLETYNYSIVGGSGYYIFQASLLAKYLKQIGVKIVLNNLTAQDYWDKVLTGGLEFYTIGWGAGFNDPVEMLDPLYSIYGYYNDIHFNDTQVQAWLEQGLVETNEAAREQIYYNIQKRFVEELYPVVWIYSPVRRHIWASNVKGIPLEGAQFKFILKDAYFL